MFDFQYNFEVLTFVPILKYKSMNMKKVLLTTFFVSLSIYFFAQMVQPSPKVLAGYGASAVSAMGDEEIKWLNFLADQMCIVNLNPEKSSGLEDINNRLDQGTPAKVVVSSDEFNPFFYHIEPQESNQYYRFGETGYTVFVYSKQRLEVLYDRYKKNSGH